MITNLNTGLEHSDRFAVPPESVAQVAGAAAAGEVLLGRLLAGVQLLLQAAAAVPGDGFSCSWYSYLLVSI